MQENIGVICVLIVIIHQNAFFYFFPSLYIIALEVLPKLGRRKVLVNGKPCGRNELIADFIYQETGKVRDRKQVSSHIQVLKNTRKNDPECKLFGSPLFYGCDLFCVQ
jgi:hypothetical protein